MLLYRLPAVYINDYYIRPRKADGKWTMDVEITLEGKLNGCEVALSLEKDGKIIAGEAVKAERLTYMTFDISMSPSGTRRSQPSTALI